ncbi:MAG: hypothetical protein R6W67_00975 [Bacteroidales bacterium]
MIRITGIRVVDRIKETGFTQDVLSKYAGLITTRLGFHELNDGVCSREGFILLHLKGDPAEWKEMSEELRAIGGIEVKAMDFSEGDESEETPGAGQEGVRILGVLVRNGSANSKEVQRLLTLYGCSIRTRLGVNERHFGEQAGLIILELAGIEEEMERLEADLRSCGNCIVRRMTFGR